MVVWLLRFCCPVEVGGDVSYPLLRACGVADGTGPCVDADSPGDEAVLLLASEQVCSEA